MFMLSPACVVCHRDHFTPHDVGCLYAAQRLGILRPADNVGADTDRWWLPAEEAENLDRVVLTDVMAGMFWRRFTGVAPAEITHLSLPLQPQRWVLTAYAREKSRSLPCRIFAIRHTHPYLQRSRTFWIAGTTSGRAAVFALDLSWPAAA